MINITNLTFQYPGAHQSVLENVDLQVQSATLTLVTGASGSGKSTLLRCLNGLIPHFSGGKISGSIDVFGSDPITAGPEGMAAKVGFVFQEPEAQFVFDIVEDEIAFSLENAGMPREEMHQRLNEVCHHLDLEHIRQMRVQDISGGEKQRVAIASALVNRPKVLILDEPTSQLDPVLADEILQYIVSLKTDLGLTILISEHRLERLLPYTDAIIHLTSESKLLFGSPQEIIPQMTQVPPIIEIARWFNLSPLPLSIENFPEVAMEGVKAADENRPPHSPPARSPILKIDHLSTTIAGQQILKDVSLKLREGEIIALLGPNGAGKTTLLRSILGLIPSGGEKSLFGKDINQIKLSEIIQSIAYLPQNPNDLLFAETVLAELKVTLKNHDRRMDEGDVIDYLEIFGLAEKQSRYPRDLSVGERQHTALAAITVHGPNIIFLDEPTRGLDYRAKDALADLLQKWRHQHKAILVITHDIEFAAQLADRVAILEKGQVFFTGSPKVAFSEFPQYQTQTARLFPGRCWITPDDVRITSS